MEREMSELQIRLTEAEDTLNAIRSGAVDALVVHTPQGERLFTLKGADQTYRALVEAMSEGAVAVRNGAISYCNHHVAEMAGLPLEDIFGESIFRFVDSESFRRLIGRLQRGAQTRGSMEAVLWTVSGRSIPVLLSGSRFQSEEKMSVGLVLTDISERKLAEQLRQELSQSILSAQEEERKRVARDLHDGVNQLLASAKYRLHSIASEAQENGQPKEMLQVLGLVEKAIANAR